MSTVEKCPRCGATSPVVQNGSCGGCGGVEDEHYRCKACGKDWWIEGPDA